MLGNDRLKNKILKMNPYGKVVKGKPGQLFLYQEKDHHGHKEPAVPKGKPYWNNRYNIKRR